MGSSAAKKVSKKSATKKDADKSAKTSTKAKKLSSKKRDQIIVEHQEHGKRLAWSFLKSWRIRMNPDEVVSVVGAALCEAAVRFDPSKGVAFKTFFFYHLRGMLLKEISRMIQEQKVLKLMPGSTNTETLPTETATFGWNMSTIENNNPERIIEKRQVASACWEACAQLDPLEQEVLIRYFVYDEPLVHIAEELEYCRCHISRVKSRALGRMGEILSKAVHEEKERTGISGTVADIELPNPSTLEDRRKKSYTGGRGRRKQRGAPKKSKALEKILAEAY